MSLGFTSAEARHEEKVLHGEVTELENAVVAFFWEGKKPRMGTLTVTLPDIPVQLLRPLAAFTPEPGPTS